MRGESGEAKSLAKTATTGEQHLTQPLPFEVLKTQVTKKMEALLVDVGITWMMSVLRFLIEDELPEGELEAKQVIKKSLK